VSGVATAETYDAPMREWVHGDFVSRFYNSFREHADRFHFVMSLVRELKPASVLDLGCSYGAFGALVRWGHGYAPQRITGVDFSSESLAFALRYSGYDTVITADLQTRQDFPKADLVLCMEVLEHVQDPWTVAVNAAQASTKWVLFSTPVEEEFDGLFHVRHVSPENLLAWASAAGLYPVRAQFLESEFCEKPHWKGWNFLLCAI